MSEILKYSTIIIPSIVIFTISQFFIVKNAGKNVPFRPPAFVFAIIWPILLLLLGISWYLRIDISIYYIILLILLGFWIIIYKYSKLISFIDILLSIIVTTFLIFYMKKNKFKLSNILLIPLLLWLIFASTLNAYEVIN